MNLHPPLSPRALARYWRLRVEVDAFASALEDRKPSGALGHPTIEALESVCRRANALFCRHADLPHFAALTAPALNQADFIVLVARLGAALRRFEALHADQLGPWPDEDDDPGDNRFPPRSDGLPSPHI